MSKDYTFNLGDFVVYPAHGVGQVTERQATTVAGQDLDFFHVYFTKNKLTVQIQSDQVTEKGLRHISTPDVMDTVKSILGKPKLANKKTSRNWNKRKEEYTAKINSGDPLAIADVIHKVYKKENQNSSAHELYQKAMSRLAPEYALSYGIEEAEAQAEIEKILDRAVSAE